MAKIFGITTTIILLVSLFVTYKNKSRYQDEIDSVIVEKDRLRVSQERLAAAQQRSSELAEAISVAQARTAELTAEADEQRAENTRLESQIQSKTSESNRNRERISELQQQVGSFDQIDQIMQRLHDLQAEIDEINNAEDGVQIRMARVDRIAAQALQMEADNTTAVAVLEGYARGESRPGMSTRIRSIYPNWGFVTLASGGISGIAGNSTMDVIRNDQIIAKLQITAVEPNSATATIIPGSVDDGVNLAVGDTVVPGTRLNGN